MSKPVQLTLMTLFFEFLWANIILALFLTGIILARLILILYGIWIICIGLSLEYRLHANLFLEIVENDNQWDFLFFNFGRSLLKSIPDINIRVKILWYSGRFAQAYSLISDQTEAEILSENAAPVLRTVKGWDYFQHSDLAGLMRIHDYLERTGKESDITTKNQEDQLALTVIEIWIALLNEDQTFYPYPLQTEGGIYEMERAYWSGIWYQHMEDDRKAAEEFQLVWLNGQESLRAQEAKKYLENKSVTLRKPEKYTSPAVRKYIIGNLINLKYFVGQLLILLFANQMYK